MALAVLNSAGPAPDVGAAQVLSPASARIRCVVAQSRDADRVALRRIAGRSVHRLDLAEAANLAEARSLLAGDDVDLVLLDPVQPDGDGLDLAAELCADGSGIGIPVIIVAGDRSSERIVRAMRSGACDYLVRDGLTVNRLDRAVTAATGDVTVARDTRRQLADLRQEVVALRRAAQRNMHLLKAQLLPLLACAWKVVDGDTIDQPDQPGLARRLVRLTRSVTSLIDETAIHAATRHGDERPVPVDLGNLVSDLLAGDSDELRGGAAHIHCGPLPVLMARRSHMVMLFRELLLNAVRTTRLGAVPEIALGTAADPDGNPIIWMTENGLPLSARKQVLGARTAGLLEPARHPAHDPHAWSLCQRLAEKNRGHFRIAENGETGCKVMIRFAREMLV